MAVKPAALSAKIKKEKQAANSSLQGSFVFHVDLRS
jgi:hypothetical protein